MQIKKITSLFLVLVLVLSVFAIPVYAIEDIELTSNVVTSDNIRYIVNEDFSLNDLGGFTLNSTAQGTLDSVETEPGSGNYALKFVPNQGYWTDGEYAILNVDGADFTADKELVIRARIKFEGENSSTRAMFKYNKAEGDTTDASTYKGMFFTMNANGLTSWQPNASGVFGSRSLSTTSTTFKNNWINVEIIFSDAENATMVVYDDNGGTTGVVTMYPNSDISTGIENIFIRGHKEDKIYVDYVQIYEVSTVVKASVPANTDYNILYRPEEVSLAFGSPIGYIDGGIEIIDEMNNVVPHSGSSYDQTNRTYKVFFEPYLAAGNYKFVIKDTINPLPVGGVEGLIFENRTIPFTVYETMPPKVESLTIDGLVAPGNTITADYKFVSETEADDNSIYTWLVSESGEEGTFSPLVGFNEKTLDVTEANVAQKYIMLSVIPQSNGLAGAECFSNILVPEIAPVISNLKLSSQTLFYDSYLTALYQFSDINGDAESGTTFEWFKSGDGISDWEVVSTEDKYHITEDDKGFYFKCKVTPKSDSLYESTGLAYETEVAGPVSDLLETTNLFVDPGFENTAIGEHWLSLPSSESPWEGVSITSETARTGDYSLHMPPRSNVGDSWRQLVNVTKDNIYILGGYAKKANDKLTDTGGLWPYPGTSGLTRYDKVESEYTYTITKRWQLCVGTFIATETRLAGFTFLSFTTIDTLDAVFDDFYVGELLVADIETYDIRDITIPQKDGVSYALSSGKVLNQLGTDHGLKDQIVSYELPETDGVYIENGNLIVTNKAKAGKVNIRIYCEPTYAGANQAVFEKYVTINLLPNNDTAPKAYDVVASGTVATGVTLTGSYEFYQIDSKNDASTVCWTYCDTEDGQYVPIPNTNGLTAYTVESAYADKYIKFMVTPKTDDGMVGRDTYSNFVTMPRPPVARDVTFSGDYNVGKTVEATYTHYDPNGDNEGASLYRWMADGVIIPGQTGKTLTLTENMIGKYIKVGVTPVSQTSPEKGTEVWSEAKLGPALPQAVNVSMENNNGRLIGKYIYTHPHDNKENGTTFRWTVDGVTVSDKIYYVPNFNGVKTVVFTVTPKSEGNPSVGNSVSVLVTIGSTANGSTGGGGSVGGGSSSGGGGGYGGGGGASSGSGTGITNINDMNRIDPTKEPQQVKSDIEVHWGKTYIEEMEKRGVMTADENGNFNPDANVTREEMVTFLFDALGLEETTYDSQFSDVTEGDFANKLQTMLDNGTIAKDTSFRPEDTISREEMCKILYISLKNAGKLNEVGEDFIKSFADYDLISDWARVYVNAIYGNKIMVGISETEFDAKGTVTKAQAATMLVRILNLTEEE